MSFTFLDGVGLDSYNSAQPHIIDKINTNNLIYINANRYHNLNDTSLFEITAHDIPNVSIIDPDTICSNEGIVMLNTINELFITI